MPILDAYGLSRYFYEMYCCEWKRQHGIDYEAEKALQREWENALRNDEFDGRFEDYEQEYGYNGEIYACYDEFMDNEYSCLMDAVRSFKTGDCVGITISDCCTGLAHIVSVHDTHLSVQMVDDRYSMCYPNSHLESLTMDVPLHEIVDLEKMTEEDYECGLRPRSLSSYMWGDDVALDISDEELLF